MQKDIQLLLQETIFKSWVSYKEGRKPIASK